MLPAVFLRQLWQNHRTGLLVVGVLLVGNLVIAAGLHSFLVPMVSDREQQLIRRQAEVRSGGGSNAPAVRFAQGERDVARFREQIPPYREFTGLITELEQLAEEAGLELAQVSYSNEPEPATELLRYTLSFEVIGEYAGIKQFVHAMEQSPRLLLIRQMTLQGGSQDSGAEVNLRLSIDTFFRSGQS